MLTQTPADLSEQHFSENWFDHNAPHWQRWLQPFAGKADLRVLEIGSFEGRSTLWLCQHILTGTHARMDCVDLFTHDPVYGDYHARFRNNIHAYADRITEHAGYSADVLRRVQGPYDIVYIDGWHSAFGVLADGVMAWPLLNVGGVMIFDDYLWAPPKLGPPRKPNAIARGWAKLMGQDWRRQAMERHIARMPTESPKLGVDGLLATLHGYYELLGITNQLAVRKTRGFQQGQVGYDT